jgi:hypothetical protein
VADHESWEDGPDAFREPRLNVWDRITFHTDLTVRELREIAASYGVPIRPKASRDEVALIMRRHGIAS